MDEPLPMKPVRLVIGDVDRPFVWIGGNDGENLVDIVQAVERIGIDISPGGVMAQITLRVDLDFDFPVNEVQIPSRSDSLEGVTAKELDEVVSGASMSTSLGEQLLRHLRDRSESRPH